jgi:hypothetical protein
MMLSGSLLVIKLRSNRLAAQHGLVCFTLLLSWRTTMQQHDHAAAHHGLVIHSCCLYGLNHTHIADRMDFVQQARA